MKRMYFLTSNLDSTESISRDLHNQGIKDWHIHVLSKDEAGLNRRRIHSANAIQKLDIIRYGVRGAMIGFIIALILTGITMKTASFGEEVSGFLYLAMFVCITCFGAWVGGLTGVATENQKISLYHDDIEAGKHLILIDVKPEEEQEVRRIMQVRHPEAAFKRVGSTGINPFKPRPTVTG